MRNRRTTPNWEEVAYIIVAKLDEIADSICWNLECGEDPALTVTDALEELELFVQVAGQNPETLEGSN